MYKFVCVLMQNNAASPCFHRQPPKELFYRPVSFLWSMKTGGKAATFVLS